MIEFLIVYANAVVFLEIITAAARRFPNAGLAVVTVVFSWGLVDIGRRIAHLIRGR